LLLDNKVAYLTLIGINISAITTKKLNLTLIGKNISAISLLEAIRTLRKDFTLVLLHDVLMHVRWRNPLTLRHHHRVAGAVRHHEHPRRVGRRKLLRQRLVSGRGVDTHRTWRRGWSVTASIGADLLLLLLLLGNGSLNSCNLG
jgi:hypothetical protein